MKVDHSVHGDQARMRVIWYAEPTSLKEAENIKKVPDSESLEARWVSIPELLELGNKKPGLRGEELLEWAAYLQNGG